MNKRGFTLVEIMVAVAILAIVGFAVSRFIIGSKKSSVRIADSASCENQVQSFLQQITDYGQKLNPADPVFSNDQIAESEEEDRFISNFNPLPVIQDLGGGLIRMNTPQLGRSTAAALMSAYNGLGSTEYCDGNDGRGRKVTNADLFDVNLLDAEVFIKITPLNSATGTSLGCVPPPLYFGPMSRGGNYGPTFVPPTHKDFPQIVLPEPDRGFEVQVHIEYNQGGITKSCQTQSKHYFSYDPDNISTFNNIIFQTGSPGTQHVLSFDTEGDSDMDTEFLSCGTSGGSQLFRDVTVRIPYGTGSGMEMASAMICRGHVLPDGGTAGGVGNWGLCENFEIPAPGGVTARTVNIDTANSQVVMSFEGLTPDLTYQVEIASFDSGLNQKSHLLTFSIDSTRPAIASLQEGVTNFINPRITDFKGIATPFTIPELQCDASQTNFVGTITGTLLDRTLVDCSGTGFNGPITRTGLTCSGNHTATPDQQNLVTMVARDICGESASPASYSWPVLVSPPTATPDLKITSPQGLFINHGLISGFTEYPGLVADFCDCENRFTTDNYCEAGRCTPKEFVDIIVVDACGRTIEPGANYCPSNSWSATPNPSWWGQDRCLSQSGLADNQLCKEVEPPNFGPDPNFPGCFAVADCNAEGFREQARCIAGGTPYCTSGTSCQLGLDGCYSCACKTITPFGYEQLAQCQSVVGAMAPPQNLDNLCEVIVANSVNCHRPYTCAGNAWATSAQCDAQNSCGDCEAMPLSPPTPSVSGESCWSCRCDPTAGEYFTEALCTSSAPAILPTQTCGEVMGATQLCWRRFDCTLSELAQAGAMFTSGEGSINPDLQGYGTCASGTCSTVDLNGTGFDQAGGICHFADLGVCPIFSGASYTSEGMCLMVAPPTSECRDFAAVLSFGGSQLDTFPTECWYGVNCPAASYGTQTACHADTTNSCDGTPSLECAPRTGGCWECNATTTTTTLCVADGSASMVHPSCGSTAQTFSSDASCCSGRSYCTPNQPAVCGDPGAPTCTAPEVSDLNACNIPCQATFQSPCILNSSTNCYFCYPTTTTTTLPECPGGSFADLDVCNSLTSCLGNYGEPCEPLENTVCFVCNGTTSTTTTTTTTTALFCGWQVNQTTDPGPGNICDAAPAVEECLNPCTVHGARIHPLGECRNFACDCVCY